MGGTASRASSIGVRSASSSSLDLRDPRSPSMQVRRTPQAEWRTSSMFDPRSPGLARSPLFVSRVRGRQASTTTTSAAPIQTTELAVVARHMLLLEEDEQMLSPGAGRTRPAANTQPAPIPQLRFTNTSSSSSESSGKDVARETETEAETATDATPPRPLAGVGRVRSCEAIFVDGIVPLEETGLSSSPPTAADAGLRFKESNVDQKMQEQEQEQVLLVDAAAAAAVTSNLSKDLESQWDTTMARAMFAYDSKAEVVLPASQVAARQGFAPKTIQGSPRRALGQLTNHGSAYDLSTVTSPSKRRKTPLKTSASSNALIKLNTAFQPPSSPSTRRAPSMRA